MRGRAGLALLALAVGFGPVDAAFAQASPPITIPGVEDVQGTAENTGGSIGAVVTGLSGQGSGGGASGGSSGGTGARPVGRSASRGGSSEELPVGNGTGPLGSGCRPTLLSPELCEPGEPVAAGAPAPAAPRPAVQVAREISQRTALPLPAVRTSPPAGADQLVNLPTWMWVEDWNPRRASASEGPLTVTVVASPRSVLWRMGDGSEVVCGPGTPWNPALRDEQQSTDCSHTYTRSSANQPGLVYQAQATMTWDVDWTATNGESGGLGPATRSVDFTMRVAEGQAIVTWSGR